MKILHFLAAGLLSATSGLARRVAVPLLLLGTGLLLVQPCAADSGVFIATGSLVTPRLEHSATLLPNGKVLVAGGLDSSFVHVLKSAELYDPATGTWTPTGDMRGARTSHTAILLPNGKVLAEVGALHQTDSTSQFAELYDPASGTWTFTGPLVNLFDRTATLLPNGKVLLAGGEGFLYDPASGTWTATGSLGTARGLHTATLLPTGKVLVAGGSNSSSFLASAELYDPASGTWSVTGSLGAARQYHTATLLPNGNVLVAGGSNDTGALASAELYGPQPAPGALLNISTRMEVLGGEQVLLRALSSLERMQSRSSFGGWVLPSMALVSLCPIRLWNSINATRPWPPTTTGRSTIKPANRRKLPFAPRPYRQATIWNQRW